MGNMDNTIYGLQFADDQVVMAQIKEDLKYICRKFQEEYSKCSLTMNIAEAKYMSLGTDKDHLELNGYIITGSTEFRYMGSIFTKDGRDTKNKRHWDIQARKIIGSLNGLQLRWMH